MNKTVERLIEYLNYKSIAIYKAELDFGLSNGLIGKAVKVGSSLGSDKLEKLLKKYTDLSAEWLLRGEGPMIKGEDIVPEQVFKSLGMPANSDKIISTWRKMMEYQKEMTTLFESYSSESAVQIPCNDDEK